MTGLSGLLGIARDAMNSQSYGLSVTGQNVANVNTPGYVRREAMLETAGVPGAPLGGVRTRGTRRAADSLIERRWYQSNSFASSARERDAALSQVEALFKDATGSGIGSDIQALFSSFASLSASPSDPTARGVVLAKAQGMARTFRDTSAALSGLRSDLLSRAQAMTVEVNDLTSRIARLNRDISVSEVGGDVAAGLRDQRGELVRQLSERVEVNVLENKDGLVILSGGIALVESNSSASLSVQLDGAGMLEINARRPSGATVDITSSLDGGSLAGLRRARDVDIVAASQALDQLAYDVGTNVNAQHAAGFGLDGVTGRDLFVVSPPPGSANALSVSAGVAGNPNAIAAASTSGTLPGGADNAAALAKLASVTIASGGTRTAAEAYGDLVGRVGSLRASASREVEVRGAMQDQLHALRDSLAGVSLDEEMVSLTRYQRAYEAALKLVSTVDELLGELLRRV